MYVADFLCSFPEKHRKSKVLLFSNQHERGHHLSPSRDASKASV